MSEARGELMRAVPFPIMLGFFPPASLGPEWVQGDEQVNNQMGTLTVQVCGNWCHARKIGATQGFRL